MGSMDTAGNKAALDNANAAFNQYNRDYGNWQNQYNQHREQADQLLNQYKQQSDQAWGQDFGANAADFTNKANQQGIQLANQQLDQGARAATNQAQLASRAAGLSKGQAAMNAAGASNQMYQNNWNNAVQQGTQNYGNATQMNQQNLANQQNLMQGNMQNRMGNSLQGMGMAGQNMQGAMGTQAQVGANQLSGWDKAMKGMKDVGGVVEGVGSAVGQGMALFSDKDTKQNVEQDDWYNNFIGKLDALSDERIKEPIPEDDLLSQVAQEINNYTYHYKPGVGEDPSIEYSGPMAQELLQVDGYRSTVFEDPSGLLKVDTGRLALVNAGMIADLSKRLLMLEEFIASAMQGLQTQADVE